MKMKFSITSNSVSYNNYNFWILSSDILAGGVGFIDNDNMCYINTINWEEILAGYLMKPMIVFNSTLPERRCK